MLLKVIYLYNINLRIYKNIYINILRNVSESILLNKVNKETPKSTIDKYFFLTDVEYYLIYHIFIFVFVFIIFDIFIFCDG